MLLTLSGINIFAQDVVLPPGESQNPYLHHILLTPEQQQYVESIAFRSDTFDLHHIAIHLDEVNYGAKMIRAHTEIFFSAKMEGQNSITFDLLDLQVDSVLLNGSVADFEYNSPFLFVRSDSAYIVGDTNIVVIFYGGKPTLDPSGFGGFDFQDGYAYNLGIGITSFPHNFGRGWFPCFDNFVERSTYDFFITTTGGFVGYGVGDHISTDTLEEGKRLYHYHMDKPIPTYLAAVAISNYQIGTLFHQGIEREYPIEIVAKPQDLGKFMNSMAYMSEALDAFEYWYGPYQWNRVGYVITYRGAMEHPTLTSYPASVGLNGDPEDNMRLMSHELAHHWWGDITTLSTSADMWIKEGNAEYGYHLFVKEFKGEEAFNKVVSDNQYYVIETAHRSDKGYRPLSGMPKEYTYGTTTYNKGAAVLHNLHSYLGDSLFKVAQRSILSTYAFSHLNAAQYRDQVSIATSKDMTDFFDAWIYQAGLSAFQIDSVAIIPDNDQFDVRLYIRQKLFYAPYFHKNVPMKVTFFDQNWNKHHRIIELPGEYSEVNLKLDFYPVAQLLNEHNFLNNGQISYNQVIKSKGNYKYENAKFDFKVESLKDSLLFFAEHVWGAPDPIKRTDLDLKLSSKHYWNIGGVKNPEDRITARFSYTGLDTTFLDHELVYFTENDIILLYRPDAGHDWIEYPYATKSIFIPGDKKGSFIVDSLLFGQYTFANGDYFSVKNEEVTAADEISVDLSPNPTKGMITLSGLEEGNYVIQVTDLQGRTLEELQIIGDGTKIDISRFPPGVYLLKISDTRTNAVSVRKVLLQ